MSRQCGNSFVEGFDYVECEGRVEHWWTDLCETCRLEVKAKRTLAGLKWWDCPPKPYLRRGFQLLGLAFQLLSWFEGPGSLELELRGWSLRQSGYWMSRPHFDRMLRAATETEKAS